MTDQSDALIETALVLAAEADRSVRATCEGYFNTEPPLLCDIEARALDEAERLSARGYRVLPARRI